MKRLLFDFALITCISLFCSCQNKNNCSCQDKNDKCFDSTDYSTYLEFGSLNFKDAILDLYSEAGVPLLDTNLYPYEGWPYDKWDAVEWHWKKYPFWQIYMYDFKRINAYEDFLSNESECNQGKEPLKEFICKYAHDEKFRKSRIRIEGSDNDSIFNRSANESFKFYYPLCGPRKSWEEISYLHARFVQVQGNDIAASYSFSRINEQWFLTDYFDFDDYWD